MLWLFRSLYVMALYTAMIIYTGLRLYAFIRYYIPSVKKQFFWLVHLLLSYSFFFFAIIRLDRFGFIFLFDSISLVLFLRNRKKQEKERTDRQSIVRLKVGIALIFTILILVYGSFHARDIKAAHYNLNFAGFAPGSLKVVLVSDLHIGPTVGKKWVSRIVDRINEAEPDMVCMAGDIFDSGITGMADPEGIAFELRRIKAPLGVYACPGNHDVNRRTRSLEEINDFLSAAGILLLADESVIAPYSVNKPDIVVTGRRDARPIGMPNERLSVHELHNNDLKNDVPYSIKPFLILLDHQPIELPETAKAGFDLALCGHTHKGQLFPGTIFTYFIFKKTGATHYGHWQKGNTRAIISSGAGIWGPPLRFGTNSEIAIIDIQFK